MADVLKEEAGTGKENSGGILSRLPSVEYSRTSVLALRSRVLVILDKKEFAKGQVDFLRKTKLITYMSEQRFSEWRASEDNWAKLTSSQYKYLRKFLVVNYLWQTSEYAERVRDVDDNLFFSLLHFFDVGENTVEDILNITPGNYILYQHSLLRPNYIVVGHVKVWFDEQTQALKIDEQQKFSGSDGSASKTEEFEGYLIRKLGRYVIVVRGVNDSSVKVYFLPHAHKEDGNVVSLAGSVVGMVGSPVFMSAVYLERTEKPWNQIKKKLDIYPEERIPDTILAHLKKEKDYNNISII